MKAWFRRRGVLLALLLAGLIAAVLIAAGRVSVERQGRTYDIVMDYGSLKEMVDQSEEDMDFWLEHLKKAGLQRVALVGTTFQTLQADSQGAFQVQKVEDIRKQFRWQEDYPEQVAQWITDSAEASDLLVTTADPALFRWLTDSLEQRAQGMHSKALTAEDYSYLWMENRALSDTEWSQLDLGIWPETAEIIQAHGLQVVPRPKAHKGINGEKYLQAVLAEQEKYDSPYYFSGGSVMPGYDNPAAAVKTTAAYLRDTGNPICIVENSDQSLVMAWGGLENMLKATDYQAVRVFSVWSYIQNKYAVYGYPGPEEIINALYRAAYERGCRLLYLKSILKTEKTNEYVTNPADYTQMIRDLDQRMTARGFTREALKAQAYYDAGTLLRLLVGFGAIAALVLLLDLLIPLPGRFRYGLLVLGCAGVAGAFYVMPNTSKLLLSMGGGIVMPSLAAVALNRYIHRYSPRWTGGALGPVLLGAVAAAAAAFAVSLCGALFASAALSESAYMLETKLYRGVKLMQLVPICAAVLSFFLLFWWDRYVYHDTPELEQVSWSRRRTLRHSGWQELLDTPIQVRHVCRGLVVLAVAALLAAAGVYYLSRTGNTTQGVSSLELVFRNLLENRLAARPRTKEFLIGTPCLMLLIWSARRHVPVLPLVFEIAAVIGLTSVVNTFLHIRTMFTLSLIRVVTGLAFGLVIGLVLVLCAEGILRLVRRIKRSEYV